MEPNKLGNQFDLQKSKYVLQFSITRITNN
jgi:hypothetical protein